MCQFDCATGLSHPDVTFGPQDKLVTIACSNRKADQYRQGTRMMISAMHGHVCPVYHLRQLLAATRHVDG